MVYFSALLNKFEQQMPLAFAAYNAGPHRVASWLDRKPRMEMDQFVEEIQYEEGKSLREDRFVFAPHVSKNLSRELWCLDRANDKASLFTGADF